MKLKNNREDEGALSYMNKGNPGYEDSYWEYVDAIIEQRKKNKKENIKIRGKQCKTT